MKTRHLLQLLACLSLVTASRLAEANVGGAEVTIGYGGLPNRAAEGATTGVQISDGVLMHVGIGAEVGYDSNVFYKEVDPTGSPIMRILPWVELTNGTRTGAAPSGVYFNLNLSMVYREYLSELPPDANGETNSSQRAFMPAVNGLVEFSSNQTLSLSLADTFIRLEDPPYVENDVPIVRNMNLAAVQLRWAPGGGRLQGLLRYTNTYDKFETTALNHNDSMAHDLMLDLGWRWLPKTAIFMRVSQGYIMYLNDDPARIKYNSYPLRALLGIRGLVTRKVSVNLALGYANAFYEGDRSESPSTGGFAGSLSATAEISYRPSVLNSLNLGYRHDFQNSVLGNFFYVDAAYAWFQQQIAGRVAAVISGKYEHRRFQIPGMGGAGPSTRTDDFVQAGAAVDYHAAGWFFTGVGYSMMLNNSDEPPTNPSNPDQSGASFVKHQIFGRIGLTY